MLLDIAGAKQFDSWHARYGPFAFRFIFVFQMGIVFDFGDEPDKMQSGMRIVFVKLDFIVDRFGDLHLQEPELTEREEEQSLQIHAFAAGLEKAIDGGPLAIARHLTRHGQLFTEPGQEPRLNATLFFRKIGDPVPTMDVVPDLIRSRSSGMPIHAATTRLKTNPFGPSRYFLDLLQRNQKTCAILMGTTIMMTSTQT
jgi:hypothetical protein